MRNAIFSNMLKNAQDATKDVMKIVTSITDDSSFVETDKFICETTELGEAIGEGVVSGFAHISDIRVALFATNPKVLKGSIGRANAKKITKIIDSAVSAGLPLIGILDTAGARFSEGIDAMEGYATIFGALSRAYGEVPTVLAVKGVDFGLSSYFCAVTDLCIAYKNAQIATSSPLILAADTKEDPAKVCTGSVLAQNCNVVTHVVSDDKELKNVVSKYLQLLTSPHAEESDDPNRTAKAAALKSVDNIISEIFDHGSLFPMRDAYATEVKTGFARLDGVTVGYVATNGKLSGAGAGKITELLNTCESFSVPVINLVDCNGCVTSAQTDGQTIREVSDMLFTYGCLCVPKLALIYGNAIGLGYMAFVAKNNVDYSIAWTDAKIGTVDGTAAAQLLYKEEIAKAANRNKAAEKLAEAYAEENLSAPVVAQKGYLDNVIEPALSRPYLIAALQTYLTKE